MHGVEIIIGLLLAVVALAWAAARLQISYPIFLVIGGLAIGFIPGLPRVALHQDVVFLVFLPPILYYAALLTSWRDFKANLRPIALLAIGLVLFTTCLTAGVAHWLIDGMSWATAFVLGAIISPPDAVAATAVTQRLRVPKRIVTILEGESLVNDASALIVYRVAVGVVAGTGRFGGGLSLFGGSVVQFLVAAVGGIAVGLLAGVVMAWIRPRLREPSVETAVALLTPYVAYLPAEWLHLSSVLAVVTCGLYLSRRVDKITSSRVRLRAYAAWDTLIFLLNGLIFILIGLQLPSVIAGLEGVSAARAAWYAAVISVVAIVVRMVWVFPATYLPRLLSRRLRAGDPAPPWQSVFVIAWTGMRGIVSLAAALALPLTTAAGAPFPRRELIVFVTFGVILVTLVFQGLTLPAVIRWLRLSDLDDHEADGEEVTARYLGALAAVERLDNLRAASASANDRLARLRATYDERVAYYSRQLMPDGAGDGAVASDPIALACESGEEIEREALAAERQMIVRLRDQGVIGDEVLRRIQEELDHEESRLEE